MNYWDYHGMWFLISMLIFPRLTLFFGTGIPFSIWTWLGWLFVPRFVAAYYATYFYWETNAILCMLAWLAAFTVGGGESGAAKSRS